MSNDKHGRREVPVDEFPLVLWWKQHREWVAGLDRKSRIKYRVFQVLVAVAILIIALTLFLRAWIRLPTVPDPPVDVNTPVQGNTSQPQPGEETGEISFAGAQLPDVAKSGRKKGCYTFLLSGLDVVSNSTDTMILVTYDTENQAIHAVSLLRDTMTNIAPKGGAQKRLNTIYVRNRGGSGLSDEERAENGMNALRLEVSKLTGIYPDFYVLVEWEAIGNLVEAIGGVYFDVPYDMDYDDDTPGQDLHIHQKKGYRLLNGQDAMEVVRFRMNNDRSISLGDVGRTQIQRDFLTAVLKKCLTPEILLKLPALVRIFTENVSTDLTVGNILAFAQLAVGMDTENNVTFNSMPCYGVMYNGASLVCVQEREMLELLNSGLNPYQDDIKSSDLQLMYKKSGGGFGVTNGELADPSVAEVPVVTVPEDPDDPDEEDPDSAEEPGEAAEPGTEADPNADAKPNAGPGGADAPPDIGAIDPSEVFPASSPDVQGEQEPSQPAA